MNVDVKMTNELEHHLRKKEKLTRKREVGMKKEQAQ